MLVDFYHLSSTPLDRVLPQICEKILAGGERLLVVGDAPLLERLDTLLWNHAPDTFLPHGRSGGPRADSQPILLSETVDAANQANNIAIADGLWRDEALTFGRTFYFFDAANLEEARSSWRALKDRAGVERRYWKQDERGKWVQGP